ncbi:hypothetical protein [Massilia oculi]|uniref:hypothetical protein n=1 Tax=Massilia oculi TaxID=945844 RepID=UPI001AAE7B2D|nr:hypothetical protein [Massilia oculi]
MIETFLDESKLPYRTLEQKVFDASVDYVFRNFPKWGREVNATLAALNALAAGGVYAFPYVFDSSTVDADPGVGKLRLSSATQNAATVMRMDLQTFGGTDMTNVLADLRAATSAVKGSVRVVKMTDPSKWLIFDVTAVAIPTGYRNLTMTWRATGGGLASPFTNGDALMVFIDRNGDSGTVPGATELLATVPVPAGVSAVNALNVFDADHDWYFAHFTGITQSGQSQVFLRLAVGGALVSTTAYQYANAGNNATTQQDAFIVGATNEAAATKRSGVLQIGGVNSAEPKAITWDGAAQLGGTMYAAATRGMFLPTSVVTGFGVFLQTQGITFTGGTIRVYGVRKA